MYNEYPMLGLKTNSLTSKILSYRPVRNVYDWGKDIFRQYGTQNYDQKIAGKPIGMQIAHKNGQTLEQHIGYEIQDTPWKTTFVRGHEEGHALHAEGRQDKLLEILYGQNVANNYAPGNYWKTSSADKEYFAHLAGLYAMQRAGYDVKEYGPQLVAEYGAPQLEDAVNNWLGHNVSTSENKFSLPDFFASSSSPKSLYALLEKLMTIYDLHTSGMRIYSDEYEMAK